MADYMLARYHKRRQEAIEFLGSKCVVCGTAEKLELDHIDPKDKIMAISKIWSYSLERFWQEVKKCQLLCHEHHKMKTNKMLSVEHGGGKTGKKNCKCQPCRDKRNAYMRAWKKGAVS